MAINAYEAYKMQSNCQKVIVEVPGHAVGTVVDIIVDSFDKVEHITENVCESIKKETELLSRILLLRHRRHRRWLISLERSWMRNSAAQNPVTECTQASAWKQRE